MVMKDEYAGNSVTRSPAQTVPLRKMLMRRLLDKEELKYGDE